LYATGHRNFRFQAIILLVLALLLIYPIKAQNETKKWYFGNGAGLDFSLNPPTLIANSSMTVAEGCVSIADASGSTLFYSDGNTIWDKTNAVMANGTGILGGNTPSQCGVVIQAPNNSNLYYFFTVPDIVQNFGFRYSLVDISLASGNGSVTVKNSLVFSGNLTEKISATKHCNGIDYWIIVHESNSNTFRSYLLTSAGISTCVVSNSGTVYSYDVGCMKISPNGKKIGVAFISPGFEILDFDNATGVINNSLFLSSVPNLSASAYGVEFSPDGSKLYGSIRNSSFQIWQ
jgi:hypothetical protein